MLKGLSIIIVSFCLFFFCISSGIAQEEQHYQLDKTHFKDWKSTIDEITSFYINDVKFADTTTAFKKLASLEAWALANENFGVEALTKACKADKLQRDFGESSKAQALFDKALLIAQKSGDPTIIASLKFKRGLSEYSFSHLAKGIALMAEANELVVEKGLQTLLPYYGEHLYNLGRAFYDVGDLQRAKPFLVNSLKYEFKRPFYRMQAFNTLALMYSRLNKTDSALQNFNATMHEAIILNNIFWQALTETNLGNLFQKNGQKDSSYIRWSRALNLLKLLKVDINYHNLAFEIRLNIFKNHSEKITDLQEFIRVLDQGQYQSNNMRLRVNYFEAKAQYFKSLNKLSESVLAYDSAMKLTKLLALKTNEEVSEIEKNRIDTEKELNRLHQLATVELLENQKENLFLSFILMVAFFGFGAVWQLYNNNKQKIKIIDQNLEIEEA